MTQPQVQISPGGLQMLKLMSENGRVRTSQDLHRLWCIELKGLGFAIDPIDDTWELTPRGTALLRR